jgi:hypothetical protein
MLVHDGRLVVGGGFTEAGGLPAANIAAWDGQAWSFPNPGINGPVWALAEYKGSLYVGGAFNTAGNILSMYVARWGP